MKNALFTSLTVSLLLLISCKEKSTNPPDTPLPEGYQHDVPWPSLADSPWPMNHGDPQSTGRSKYIGPQIGSLNKIVETLELSSGIVIGYDSTIYCSSSQLFHGGLYSFSYEGRQNWRDATSSSYSTPVIAKDGTIYFLSIDTLYSINPDGGKKWKYPIVSYTSQMSGLTIGIDGTLYFMDGNKTLNAINPDGTKNWSLYDERFYPWGHNGLSFSPDGKTLYTAGLKIAALAVDLQSHRVKWTFDNKNIDLAVAPIVDCQGNLYVSAKTTKDEIYFYSLKSDGTIRWQNQLNDTVLYQPTIDKNGNLYVAGSTLYSFSYGGALRWHVELGKPLGCSLVCDAEGTVYAGVDNQTLKLYAVDSTGKIKWQVNDAAYGMLSDSPALLPFSLLQPSSNSANYFVIK